MCNHENREAAMVVIDPGTPERHGRDGVWCDPCLVPLVRALNDGGLPTVASCCGHGNVPGSVVLADGRQLVIMPDHEASTSLYNLIAEGSPGFLEELQTKLESAYADQHAALARVEELERQAATVRSEAAIDALTTARQAVADHRKGLSRNRSRVDARFQGRLQGLEEAAGRLTALIKSLRANEPGIEARDEH